VETSAGQPAGRAGRVEVGAADCLETTIIGFVDTALAADAHIAAYDRVLAAYNTRFGLPGDWTRRVLVRRRGPESMAGRHRLRETLDRLGLPSR